MQLTTVVVDDEKPALDLICDYVAKTPDLDLQASFRDSRDALDYLTHHAVDLLLIDINMPVVSGLELVRALKAPPKVIFITAHTKYALDGFRHNAQDYLVKPVSYADFYTAIGKVQAISSQRPELYSGEDATRLDYIFIKVASCFHRVNLADIQYIEACGDYVIYYSNEQKWMSLQSMAQALAMVSAGNFMRIHRSCIVNLEHVDTVYRDYLVIAGQQKSIGKRYQQALLSHLTEC